MVERRTSGSLRAREAVGAGSAVPPLVEALAAHAAPIAADAQTLRFDFAELPLRSRPAAQVHAGNTHIGRTERKTLRSPANSRSTTLHKQLVIS